MPRPSWEKPVPEVRGTSLLRGDFVLHPWPHTLIPSGLGSDGGLTSGKYSFLSLTPGTRAGGGWLIGSDFAWGSWTQDSESWSADGSRSRKNEFPKWQSTRKTTTCLPLRRKQIAHLSPDGLRDMPYPERENRMVPRHRWGPAEAGHRETVIMND